MNVSKVTRIEVIDHSKEGVGRILVKRIEEGSLELQLQDDDRTLKIFISKKEEDGGREESTPV